VFLTLQISPVLAGTTERTIESELGKFGDTGYGSEEATPLPLLVGRIISVVLGLLGIVLLFIIIRGGFMYMTAGGDPNQTQKAKSWIINGVIGLVICFTSYMLSSYIVGRLMEDVLQVTLL